MNTSFVLAFALVAPAALSAASFEGRVNFKMTSGRGQTQEIAYNIKGDKIRVELPGQKAGMIIDTTKKETMMIMDEQKMYMTMAMPEASAQKSGKKSEDATLEKTGEKETILGYLAEKFIATHDGNKTEMWLAEGLGTFMMARGGGPMGGRGGRGGGDAAQGWEKALAGKDLFPLRVVSKDASGKETFRMEATAIDKKPLADSLFVPPAGYQKFDMGGMMKGMIPGFGK